MSDATSLRTKRQSFILTLLFIIGFAAAPFYINTSGLPQPGDFILSGWVALAAIMGRIVYPRQFVLIWGLLTFYIAVVTSAWALILSDASVLWNALFYLFNFVIGVGLFALISVNPARAKQTLRVALYISIATSAFLFVINFTPGAARQIGGFNNPNQLGFYSLLQFCTLTVLYSRYTRVPVLALVAACITVILTLFSSSLVAAVGILVAIVGFLIKFRSTLATFKIAASLTVLLLSGWLLVRSGSAVQLLDQWESRISVAERKLDTSFEERSFYLLLEYPWHMILGAGEGARYRFGDAVNEIHSGPVAILFAYGVPGITLLLTLFWLVYRRATVAEMIVLMAPAVYLTTHQGLRTTMFWMFVVIAYSYMGNRSYEVRAKTQLNP